MKLKYLGRWFTALLLATSLLACNKKTENQDSSSTSGTSFFPSIGN